MYGMTQARPGSHTQKQLCLKYSKSFQSVFPIQMMKTAMAFQSFSLSLSFFMVKTIPVSPTVCSYNLGYMANINLFIKMAYGELSAFDWDLLEMWYH